MNKKLCSVGAAVFLVTSYQLFFSVPTASADAGIWKGTTGCTEYNDKGMCVKSVTCNKGIEACSLCDALKVTYNIINYLVKMVIPIGVGFIVYGALRLMISMGNPQNVSAGTKIMTNAVIGIMVALAAWALINTLLHLIAGDVDFPWNQVTCT